MLEDITKDPEYIRGYEEAKRQIEEERKSAYRQGRKAAYREDVQREYREREYEREYDEKETIPLAEVTVSTESSEFRKELIDILREFIAIEQKNSAEIKSLDERLKALEKYTRE
jgi:hypothetical protein